MKKYIVVKIPLVNPLSKSVSCVPPPMGTGINEKYPGVGRFAWLCTTKAKQSAQREPQQRVLILHIMLIHRRYWSQVAPPTCTGCSLGT